MINEIVALSKILISVPTVIGDQNYLDLALEIVQQDLNDYKNQKFTSNGFSSILYYNTDSYKTPFTIILNCNLDVTYAKEALFKPYVKDGRLYGRGAYDMKSSAAAMILVYKSLAKKVDYPMALQITTDQELEGNFGTKYQIEQGVRGDCIINTSITNLAVSNESKGNMRLRIIAPGKRAASGYLWEGKNAIWDMKRFLDALEKAYPLPVTEQRITTINLAKISTTNKDIKSVPDMCEVELDIKYIKEDEKTILNNIKNLVPKDFTVEVLLNEFGHFTPKDNPFVMLLGKSIEKITGKPYQLLTRNLLSDLRHYNTVGGYGIGFGPIGGGVHADDEWVDIESLKVYYDCLKDFLLHVS